MMQSCLVSVIIPVYNEEFYIGKTLDSILDQTYKNLEIICVDDSSSDNSRMICERYSLQDSRIKVITHMVTTDLGQEATRNLGQEATRNLGLEAANGKYIIFVDADDTIDSRMIEELTEISEKNNADVSICAYSSMIDGNEVSMLAKLNTGVYSGDEFIKNIMSDIPWGIISNAGTKLYNLKWLRIHGLSYKKKYKFNEDMGFNLEVLDKAKTIGYINKPYYKYLIQDSGSIMSSYRENMFLTNIKTLELLESIFKKRNYLNEKNKYIYEKLYYLYMDCLFNEIKFSNKDKFVNTCTIIRDYVKFDDMYLSYKKGEFKLTSYHNLVINLLYKRRFNEIYILLLLVRIVKAKSLPKTLYYIMCTRTLEKKFRYRNGIPNVSVYMFHNITKKQSNTRCYSINMDDFIGFIVDESKGKKCIPIKEINNAVKLKEGDFFCITFDDAYEKVYSLAYPFLKKHGIPFAVFVSNDYIGKIGYLSLEEVKELNNDPLVTIGAHTITHPVLREDKNSYSEIKNSKKDLEKILLKETDYFAYPYGSLYACSKRNKNEAHKAGFEASFSTINGYINRYSIKEKNFLPRIEGVSAVLRRKRK